MPIQPEQFDILGFFVFAYVAAFALWLLWTQHLPSRFAIWVLCIIGLSGMVVDALIIWWYFL